jgi:hypothetical protein
MPLFTNVLEGVFSELPRLSVLGSCADPTNPSHWTSLINAAGLISPLLCGERRTEEVLRKKLGVLVAAAMMLFMVASPALADPGGVPHDDSCGIGREFSADLRANDFDYEGEGIAPKPGAGEASELHPTNCPGAPEEE